MLGQIRILIAEDQALQRDGQRAILSGVDGFEVLDDEAEDGLAAVHLANLHQPDLVLMDLAMPRMNGSEATREIRRRCPKTKVLVITVEGTESSLSECIGAGASGYLQKTASKDELIKAIRAVAAGRNYFDPALEAALGEATPSQVGELPPALAQLTHRERQIVKLIAEGHSSPEIANLLNISPKTVSAHRTNLMRKLDLHKAAEVAAFAHKHGLTA